MGGEEVDKGRILASPDPFELAAVEMVDVRVSVEDEEPPFCEEVC